MSITKNEKLFDINDKIKDVDPNSITAYCDSAKGYVSTLSTRMSSVLDGASDDTWNDKVLSKVKESMATITGEDMMGAATQILDELATFAGPVSTMKTACGEYVAAYNDWESYNVPSMPDTSDPEYASKKSAYDSAVSEKNRKEGIASDKESSALTAVNASISAFGGEALSDGADNNGDNPASTPITKDSLNEDMNALSQECRDVLEQGDKKDASYFGEKGVITLINHCKEYYLKVEQAYIDGTITSDEMKTYLAVVTHNNTNNNSELTENGNGVIGRVYWRINGNNDSNKLDVIRGMETMVKDGINYIKDLEAYDSRNKIGDHSFRDIVAVQDKSLEDIEALIGSATDESDKTFYQLQYGEKVRQLVLSGDISATEAREMVNAHKLPNTSHLNGYLDEVERYDRGVNGVNDSYSSNTSYIGLETFEGNDEKAK